MNLMVQFKPTKMIMEINNFVNFFVCKLVSVLFTDFNVYT